MSDWSTPARGPEESQGSGSRVSPHASDPGVEATDGYRREDLLQRSGWSGSVNGRLHVSERAGAPVEHPDRPLPVHYRAGGRRLHPGVARASVQLRGGEADVSASPADRTIVHARRAVAAAASSRPSRAIVRDAADATHHIGDGDVRLRLSLVPDGRSGRRNLARLPPAPGASVASETRPHAAVLQG